MRPLSALVLHAALSAVAGQGLRACLKANSTVPFFATCDSVSTVLPSVNSTPSDPFSYTFSGSIASPAGPFIANFSARVIGHVRVRIDNHLVVECDNTAGTSPLYCPAAYDVPIPDPHFEANSSIIHVEYVAVDAARAAFLELSYVTAPADTPQPIPGAWLSPSLPPAESEYLTQKEAAEAGWGTYDTFDMLSVALLPSGLAVAAALAAADGSASVSLLGQGGPGCSSPQSPAPSFPARFGLHAPDGASYAEVEAVWLSGYELRLQVATAAGAGADVLVAVSVTSLPAGPNTPKPLIVTVTAGSPQSWAPRTCAAAAAASVLVGACAGFSDVTVWPSADDAPVASWGSANFTIPIPAAVGASVAWASGATARPRAQITSAIAAARAALVEGYLARAGPANNETLAGLGAVMGWNAAFGPRQGIVAPISRGNFWGMNTDSNELFLWDVLLASWLGAALPQRWVALSNLIRLTKTLTKDGFILGVRSDQDSAEGPPWYTSTPPPPQHWEGLCVSEPNSKPPVAGVTLEHVAAAFPADAGWLVPLLLEPLMVFNRWWWRARQVGGLIAPGGLTGSPGVICGGLPSGMQSAKWETGLDNSPLYDAAAFLPANLTMDLVDVGLSGIYAADCAALARLAAKAGRPDWAAELTGRAATVGAALASTLWDPVAGLWLNRYFNATAPPSERFLAADVTKAPTNFYALWSGSQTAAQAETAVASHLANASEFCINTSARVAGLCGPLPSMPSVSRDNPAWADNNYWRGRSWAPMNWLVYQSLATYTTSPAIAAARTELALQARAAFLHNWVGDHRVMENHNSENGAGCDVGNALPWYHWGALDAWIALDAAGVLRTSVLQ